MQIPYWCSTLIFEKFSYWFFTDLRKCTPYDLGTGVVPNLPFTRIAPQITNLVNLVGVPAFYAIWAICHIIRSTIDKFLYLV